MSLREVPPSRPLLAHKGAASPASLRVVKGGPEEPSLRTIENDGEIALELATPDAPMDLTASAAGEGALESTPAASLLPFNLLRKRYRPEASPDLAEDEPDLVPGDLAEAPPADAAPQAELALFAKPAPETSKAAGKTDAAPESAPISRPEPRLKPRVEVPVAAPTCHADWRVGDAVATSRRASGGGWLLPLGALAAAFAALVVAWNMTNPDLDLGFGLSIGTTAPPAPEAAAEAPGGNAAPALVEAPPPVAAAAPPLLPADLPPPALGAAPERPAPDGSTSGNTETAGAAPGIPAMADSPATETSAAAPAPPQATTAAVASPPAPAAIKPSVDVVRLDASGEAVIAGRAAPNSELIILDNGKPIGTVRADAFGEWVFVPEAALPAGDHEFGLVVKNVEEAVSLPAPSKPSLPPPPEPEPVADPAAVAPAPAVDTTEGEAGSKAIGAPVDLPSTDGSGAAVSPAPVPARKPTAGDVSAAPNATPVDSAAAARDAAGQDVAAAKADFMVQLASVKTRAGAEQEWRKLQQRFPEILADMVPALDEVKLADHGTVVRVRTGAFDNPREAAILCARLTAKSQDCLVVRVSAGN